MRRRQSPHSRPKLSLCSRQICTELYTRVVNDDENVCNLCGSTVHGCLQSDGWSHGNADARGCETTSGQTFQCSLNRAGRASPKSRTVAFALEIERADIRALRDRSPLGAGERRHGRVRRALSPTALWSGPVDHDLAASTRVACRYAALTALGSCLPAPKDFVTGTPRKPMPAWRRKLSAALGSGGARHAHHLL